MLFRSQKNKSWDLTISFLAGVVAVVLMVSQPGELAAVDFGPDQYNNLISDEDFQNNSAASVEQIQAFLNEKGGALKDFSEGGRSAAQIIYDAAHGAGDAQGNVSSIGFFVKSSVNPIVILATLQKEQSLITNSAPEPSDYLHAMGYGCPDSGGCSSSYEGFTKQVEVGAWQLQWNYYRASGMGYSDYQVGQTVTLTNTDHPNLDVTFRNRATAALYRYTPHVYYGNYNFWLFFNDYKQWFLSHPGPSPAPSPSSSVEQPNDTGRYSTNTYSDTVRVSGSKPSSLLAYNGDSLISGSGSQSWEATFSLSVGGNSFIINYKDESGNLLGSKPIEITRHRSGDINGDGKIDLLDLSKVASVWEQSNPEDSMIDLNSDGKVDLLDLSIIASNWSE